MREGWIYKKWADVLTIGMLIKTVLHTTHS